MQVWPRLTALISQPASRPILNFLIQRNGMFWIALMDVLRAEGITQPTHSMLVLVHHGSCLRFWLALG